jgi:hypothetical protein
MLGLISTLILAGGVSLALEPTMSGISLPQYADFYKKWNLVTTRFREDTKELRFVYANDAAFTALKSGAKYPEGAMFAKIGMVTKSDEAFASSLVPSGTARYQFMIRDEVKFADTGGWGYALFNPEGRLFPGDVKMQVRACAACHAAVPSRQFVFSQLAPFDGQHSVFTRKADAATMNFKTVAVSILPKKDQEKIPARFSSVRMLQGEITNESFMGTIDEVRVFLVKEAIRSGLPATFVPKKKDFFLTIVPDDATVKCEFSEGVARRFTMKVTHDFEICGDKKLSEPSLPAQK